MLKNSEFFCAKKKKKKKTNKIKNHVNKNLN